MEEEAGKRIHDIVAEETWLGFREKEYAICKRFSQMDHSVVALEAEPFDMSGTETFLRDPDPLSCSRPS